MLTFWAYSSQVGPTGTTITWRGESHRGLEQDIFAFSWIAEKQADRIYANYTPTERGYFYFCPINLKITTVQHNQLLNIEFRSTTNFDGLQTICLHSFLSELRSSSRLIPGWLCGWLLVSSCHHHHDCKIIGRREKKLGSERGQQWSSGETSIFSSSGRQGWLKYSFKHWQSLRWLQKHWYFSINLSHSL